MLAPFGDGVEPVVLVPRVVERGLVLVVAGGQRERALPHVVARVVRQVRRRAGRIPVARAADLRLKRAGDRHRRRVGVWDANRAWSAATTRPGPRRPGRGAGSSESTGPTSESSLIPSRSGSTGDRPALRLGHAHRASTAAAPVQGSPPLFTGAAEPRTTTPRRTRAASAPPRAQARRGNRTYRAAPRAFLLPHLRPTVPRARPSRGWTRSGCRTCGWGRWAPGRPRGWRTRASPRDQACPRRGAAMGWPAGSLAWARPAGRAVGRAVTRPVSAPRWPTHREVRARALVWPRAPRPFGRPIQGTGRSLPQNALVASLKPQLLQTITDSAAGGAGASGLGEASALLSVTDAGGGVAAIGSTASRWKCSALSAGGGRPLPSRGIGNSQ